jgi:hypothetical protein
MFIPPKGRSEVAGRMARNRSSIKESVLISIIDFSSMIRKRQSRKRPCNDCKVAKERSDFFPLTGRRKRLCKVFPTILKAAIPVGGARKTGFCFPASRASSWIHAQVFNRVKVSFRTPQPHRYSRGAERGWASVQQALACTDRP